MICYKKRELGRWRTDYISSVYEHIYLFMDGVHKHIYLLMDGVYKCIYLLMSNMFVCLMAY